MRITAIWTGSLILACTLTSEAALALTTEEANTIASHDRLARSVILVLVRGVDTMANTQLPLWVLATGLAVLFASKVEAIPAFARKLDVGCHMGLLW